MRTEGTIPTHKKGNTISLHAAIFPGRPQLRCQLSAWKVSGGKGRCLREQPGSCRWRIPRPNHSKANPSVNEEPLPT